MIDLVMLKLGLITFLSLLTSLTWAQTDVRALEFARSAAKTLTTTDINQILLQPSLRDCLRELAAQAKYFDRRNQLKEIAAWVIQEEEGYSCEFWDESLRVLNGYNWDGHLPRNTVFSIHTHPAKSDGIRPSETDIAFNTSLGVIGLILSYKRQKISANYPGSDEYPVVFSYNEFRRYLK